MMKNSYILILLVVLLAACAPEATVTEPPAVAPATVTAAPTLDAATEAASSEVAPAAPIATSRGPELHATDPTTVSLASGGLQFVEFFRFT